MANDTLNRSYTTIAQNERAAAQFDYAQFHLPKAPHERRMHQKKSRQEIAQDTANSNAYLENVTRTVYAQFETRHQPTFTKEQLIGYAAYASQIGGLMEHYREEYDRS